MILTDLDNNPLPPHEALKVAGDITTGINTKSYVYIGFRESDGLHKIGLTDNLEQRKSQLGVEFVHVIECDAYGEFGSRAVEAALHEFFKEERKEGEWFDLFPTQVEFIKTRCVNGSKAIDFAVKFKAVLDEVDQSIAERGLVVIIADFVQGKLPTAAHAHALYYMVCVSSEISHKKHGTDFIFCSEAYRELIIEMFVRWGNRWLVGK